MKERIQHYDLLRGIAIIAVVAIHANGIGSILNTGNFDFISSLIFRQIINFAVPLFLAISGFFLATKQVNTIDSYLLFLKKQLPRVLIPFFVWSIFYSLFYFMQGLGLSTLLVRFLTFQASVPFYYLLLIIQFYILLPIFQRLGQSTKGLFFCLFISLLSCLVIFYLRYFTSISLPLIIYAGNFLTWCVFFVLGIYLKNSVIIISKTLLVLVCFLTLLFSILETWIVFINFGQISDSITAVKFSSFLYSFSIIVFLFSFKFLKEFNFLVYLGRLSFGVYFLHMFVLSLVKLLIQKFYLLNYIYSQIIIVISTVLISVITGFLLIRINKYLASKYLGF